MIKKTGPVGSFISSKINTRTAGSTVGDSKATSYEGIPSSVQEPETATTTGSSQFPEVPSSLPEGSKTASNFEDLVDEVRSKTDDGSKIPTSF